MVVQFQFAREQPCPQLAECLRLRLRGHGARLDVETGTGQSLFHRWCRVLIGDDVARAVLVAQLGDLMQDLVLERSPLLKACRLLPLRRLPGACDAETELPFTRLAAD